MLINIWVTRYLKDQEEQNKIEEIKKLIQRGEEL